MREYLETLLPEDWDGMDLFDRRSFLAGVNNIGRVGTVARTRVCNMEIWCELFGKDQGSLGRAESNTSRQCSPSSAGCARRKRSASGPMDHSLSLFRRCSRLTFRNGANQEQFPTSGSVPRGDSGNAVRNTPNVPPQGNFIGSVPVFLKKAYKLKMYQKDCTEPVNHAYARA